MERVSVYWAGFARVYIFSGMEWETLTLIPKCWEQDWSRFMSSCHSQKRLILSLNGDFLRKGAEKLLKRCCLFEFSVTTTNAAAFSSLSSYRNVHASAGHKPSHTLSVVSLSSPEKTKPQETPGPTLCNGQKASGIIIVIIELRVITLPRPL
jgi:hypothetical protein